MASVDAETNTNMQVSQVIANMTAVSNHRKMIAVPALKILADPDHSDKSFLVLLTVMERCCREKNNQGVFLGCGKDETECQLAFGFTKWFLGNFSVMFTRKSLIKTFSPFIDLHVKILNLFCDKQLSQFVFLISEYVSLLKDLASISVKRYKGEIGSNEPVTMKAFVLSESVELTPNCVLTMEGLELKSETECAFLQLNITKVIAGISEAILLYNRRDSAKLVSVLFSQLDYGSVDLCRATWDCLGRLMTSDCPNILLDMNLKYIQQFITSLLDHTRMDLFLNTSVLDVANKADVSSEILASLSECLCRLSDLYGASKMTNHQYLRVICSLVQQPQFQISRLLDNLIPSMLNALQTFPSPETIGICRLQPELWIQLLSLSQASVPTLVIIAQSEVTPTDWPLEAIEPNPKKPKMDFLSLSSEPSGLWDQLKTHWLRMLNGQSSHKPTSIKDATVLVRIAIVGVKLKLKWREVGSVLDESDLLLLNITLCEMLSSGNFSPEETNEWMELICEYLENCTTLTYCNIEKSVVNDWLAFSALPWLTTDICQSSDLEPKWRRISQKFATTLVKYQSKFANCFVKFPSSFFKTWTNDIGIRILDMEFLQVDAEALIPSLPWIVRHGKTFREPLMQCLTNILASGSNENIAEVIRNGANLVCALAGKMNVVTHAEDGLSLRCAHTTEESPNAAALKVGNISEDMTFLFLQFVFDENEHSLVYRIDLLRSILRHCTPFTDGIRSAVSKPLHRLSRISIERNLPALQRAVLKCTTILVEFWKEAVLLDCFHILFKLLLSESYSLPMVCWTSATVKDIALKLGTTPDMLFQKQVSVICDVLLSNSDPEWRNSFINFAPDLFQSPVPGANQWLSSLIPTLIPRLVLERAKGPSPFFEDVCTLVGKSPSELMAKHFSSIYVHILLNCDQREQKEVVSYVESVTRLKVLQLRGANFQSVHNDLLIQLNPQRERVLAALRNFATEGSNTDTQAFVKTKTGGNINSKNHQEQIGEYLRSRFLGILVHLDGVLLSKSVSSQTKIDALSSLSDMLHLMGAENIIAVRLKVLATLRTALQLTDEPFPRLNASAWDAFVRILGVQELGPLVSQIAVSILPLYSSCAEQIRSILYYIVVDNADALKDHLKDLHFLPELPGLEDIVYSLKKTCLSNSSIPEQLSLLMRNISHEDFDVRMQSLAHLKSIVQKNPDTIQQLIMGTNDTSEAVMTRLISALLKGCSVREEELLILYGKCFGFLGAVDPGRLSFSDQHHGDSTVYTDTLIDDDFTLQLLSLLSRSFLAPRNSPMLSILSFTIQQILKIYGSEDDPTVLAKSQMWQRLPDEMRVFFSPLVSSRYVMKSQPTQSTAPFPIYRSAVGKNYGNWIYNWTTELISKVSHPLAQELFKACLPTLRRDTNINLYLLPYIVITALWDGPSDGNQGKRIHDEIMAVLEDRGLLKSPKRMMKRYSSNASATDPSSSQESLTKDAADVNLHQLSMQAVFCLLDHLRKWLKQKVVCHHRKVKEGMMKKERIPPISSDKKFKVVQDLVDSIPNDVLSRASYQCQAYARAILHLETYLKTNPAQLTDQLGFLQKLYVALDEPDGVAGVCAIKDEEPSLEEKITAYEATGRLQDAFSCYERISQREDCSLEFYQGMLRCLLNLDLPQGALTMSNGLLQNCPEWRRNLDDYRAECAWRLGQWDTLEEVIQPYEAISQVSTKSGTSTANQVIGWGVGIGQALLACKNSELVKMESHIRSVRLSQMRVISAVNLERNSYPRAYENFIKLHILSEIESAVQLLDPSLVAKDTVFRKRFSELLVNWDQRLDGVQASVRYMEPVLNVRRVVLKLIGERLEAKQPDLTREIETEIGKSWLVSARLARKAEHFQRSHILQLVASTSPCPPPIIYVEQAKLHWAKGEQDQAITVLKRGLDKRFPDLNALQSEASLLEPAQFPAHILECLRAKLLLASYYDQTGNADMNTVIKYYKNVTEISKNWEEGWFRLAGYYDRLWNNLEGAKENYLDIARYIVVNLGRSMTHGSHYIYQALPRMLSLWMELGTAEAENPKVFKSNAGRVRLADITKAIDSAHEKIPAYKFLTAFPQLISRICHPHADVTALLRRIIAKVLVAHPQQSMWMMIAVLKSSYSVRAKRCREIIDMAASKQSNLRAFFEDATNLADRLVDLANKAVDDGVQVLSIEKHFRTLPRLLSQSQFSRVMMPLQWMMSVTLPTTIGEPSQHNPFPKQPVYIVGIEDAVEVMLSLQKPKKISLRGSDGKLYVFLCKPQDDLRKDFRLMEFNQLINRYLVRDPDSRKRNLHIRTYGVIPLNEECGLIEWIPNLVGLRPLLTRIMREKNFGISIAELRKKIPQLKDTLSRKRDIFEKDILKHFPPVFSEWFLATFPDPQDWFMARLNYVRTTAVMSMVGFIVGLGDRHGENILLDSGCGDAVHVDLSCLFNKGQSFEWPEQVPFRLTHNMTEAMGATGIEGSFRKCCEVTLRVLRKEMDTLLSVLKPFVHDPLVEWSKKTAGPKFRNDQLAEIKNEQALEHIGNIELRLQGYLQQLNSKNKVKVPLSVEGQVNQLIAEATNVDNLCQMYIGWAAYM